MTNTHLRVAARNMQISSWTTRRRTIEPALRPDEWTSFAWLAPKSYRLAMFYKDLAGWYTKRAALVDLSGQDYDDEVIGA